MKKFVLITLLISILCISCTNLNSKITSSDTNTKNSSVSINKLKVLIVDGQNNHSVWPKSTVMMKQYLENSGLFYVDVYRTQSTWNGNSHPKFYALHSNSSNIDDKESHVDATFSPNFIEYDAIISNFGYKAAEWPMQTKKAFEVYMKNGGGFVSIHAADNAFPTWLEFNKMIGLGGWGGRDEKNGPYLYYSDDGVLITDKKAGKAGTHGVKHEFKITKQTEHPILKGLPTVWMHTKDECYGKLRGPAENLTILATAFCPKDKNGTGRNEPTLMTIDYGKGRIFHTTLGHDDYSFESVGFITTFLRGVEWAATGRVSQVIPSDFPTEDISKKRSFEFKH
jgi:hypothetical protein